MVVRSRKFVFTYNNYPSELDNDEHLDAWLASLNGSYAVAGRERAPGTGTPHLQGFISFRNARTFSALRTLLPGCHVESANGSVEQCREYCTKDGNFRECGNAPKNPGKREIQRWEHARTLAKEGKFDEIPADIYVRYIGNLHRIHRENMAPVESLSSTCGVWLFGPTGSGKSRGAREAYPLIYPKPLNKWWDGYNSQEEVLIDDVDYGQVSWIGNFLKIWCDHYPFIAEKKGGSVLIRPKKVIVTSQYRIEDLFIDGEMKSALLRRFNVFESPYLGF